MDHFPERHKLLKLIQEETEYLNRPIISQDIEIVLKKKFIQKKSPSPDAFHLISTKHLKIEELIQIIQKLPKIWKKREHFSTIL